MVGDRGRGRPVLRGPAGDISLLQLAGRPPARVSYPSGPFAPAAVTKVTACQRGPAAPLRAGGMPRKPSQCAGRIRPCSEINRGIPRCLREFAFVQTDHYGKHFQTGRDGNGGSFSWVVPSRFPRSRVSSPTIQRRIQIPFLPRCGGQGWRSRL